MTYIPLQDSFKSLVTRLPELEWKLNALQVPLNTSTLPRGLFGDQLQLTAASCIDEIKSDLQILVTQTSERGARYIAQRIQQKITVLVQLCQIHQDKKVVSRPPGLTVKAISSRQQWLHSLEEEIVRLEAQKDALRQAFNKMQRRSDPQMILNLQAELGEAERHLTEIKEVLARAMNNYQLI